MAYDEIKFWNNKKWPNAKLPQEMVEKYPLNYLNKNIKEAKSILDFGPGVGRMFPAFKNAFSVEAYDISSKWEKEIKKEANDYNFSFNLYIDPNPILGKTPYKDKQFDACVVMSVLMHQRPQHIETIMKELIRVSKKVIVGTYMDENRKFSKTEQDKKKYNHDYKSICKNNNWVIENKEYGSTKAFIYFVYHD